LADATSFITIGGLWLAHHGIFRRLASADGVVMRFNILLLMLVSFLPFPTKLVAEAIDRTTAAERAAVIFFGLVLLATSVVTSALWRYVAGHRAAQARRHRRRCHGHDPADGAEHRLLRRRRCLALLAPQVAAFGYLLIAVVAGFRQRGDSTAASAPA
jgi:uncharacterized membrane protein